MRYPNWRNKPGIPDEGLFTEVPRRGILRSSAQPRSNSYSRCLAVPLEVVGKKWEVGVSVSPARGSGRKEVEEMSLSPFGRRGGFYDAHSEVNRLLDEMFGGLGRRPGSRGVQPTAEWAPSVDVLQKDGDLVVRVEMPGVKPEDVHVAVHNRVLTISGERKVDEEEERAGYYVRELRHGSFQRSMILPEGVEEEKIHARYEDGILEVTLEGAAAAREPKRIEIEVPGGQQSATDVEVGELGTEAYTPTTETARPGEGAPGATPPGGVTPESPPETPPR
jgi:HSP20 family protein